MVSRSAKRNGKTSPKRSPHHNGKWDEVGLSTVQQAANYLKVSRTKVYQFINAGELETVPMGRDKRITAESLRRLAQTGSNVLSPTARSA